MFAEHVFDEPVQRSFRADFDEDAGAGVVERVEPLDELHGRRHLAPEVLAHRLARRVRWIELAGHVGDQRDLRRLDVESLQRRHQGHGGRRDDRGVERMAHRDTNRLHARCGERVDRRQDRIGRPADDRLVVRIDVGDHGVAGRGVDDPLDLGQRPEHGRHRTVVVDRQAGHLAAAGAHCLERSGERERAGGDEGAVLAEAVPHHHVGMHTVRTEESADARVGGEHGRLGDLGLQQLLLELRDGSRVVAVDEDVGAEWASQQRRHHLVGLTERCIDDRFGGA